MLPTRQKPTPKTTPRFARLFFNGGANALQLISEAFSAVIAGSA